MLLKSYLDESSSLITVTEVESHEILYANKKAAEVLDNTVGMPCHKLFFHLDTPCSDCILQSDNQEKEGKVWSCQGRSYRPSFKRILWNGRTAYDDRIRYRRYGNGSVSNC